MSPRRLADLPRQERRRALLSAALRFIATFGGVVAIYYLVPLSGLVGPRDGIALGVGAALFVVILWWQVRQILRSELPALRAVEGVAVVIPFFLCSYASAYVVLASADPGSFTEVLTRTDALYFAIVVFGTVGLGDIAPVTDVARLVVSSQVLCDLIFIAVVLRLFAAVTKITLRQEITSSGRPEDQADR